MNNNTNIDTMGFEPAVAYDVPEFGNVHVLMKDGEPWFLSAELSANTKAGHKKPGGYLSAWIGEHSKIRELCMIVPPSSLRAVGVNGRGGRGALLVPLQAVKACIADSYVAKNFPELDKIVRWGMQFFEPTIEKLPYVVKYDKLEVVFYNYGLYVTVPSLMTSVGRSASVGGATRAKWRKEKKVITIRKEEAAQLGLTFKGCRTGTRDLMLFAGVESYLKDECRQDDKYLFLHWFLKEVVPAAKKHLEALKAQEKAEAEAKARAAEEVKKAAAAKPEPKPAKEEAPLLLNAEAVPPAAAPSAPVSLSYDELLSSWRVTMKTQEATLKELDEANVKLKETAELHEAESKKANEVITAVRGLLGVKGFDFVSDAEDFDPPLGVTEEEKHNHLLGGIRVMKQYVAMQDDVIKERFEESGNLEKQLSAVNAALAAKEAELAQADAKFKEAEEKAECEHNNCDAVLAELKAEREAKKELAAKYRASLAENEYLLKNLSDRCALKLAPQYLPPIAPAPTVQRG